MTIKLIVRNVSEFSITSIRVVHSEISIGIDTTTPVHLPSDRFFRKFSEQWLTYPAGHRASQLETGFRCNSDQIISVDLTLGSLITRQFVLCVHVRSSEHGTMSVTLIPRIRKSTSVHFHMTLKSIDDKLLIFT